MRQGQAFTELPETQFLCVSCRWLCQKAKCFASGGWGTSGFLSNTREFGDPAIKGFHKNPQEKKKEVALGFYVQWCYYSNDWYLLSTYYGTSAKQCLGTLYGSFHLSLLRAAWRWVS